MYLLYNGLPIFIYNSTSLELRWAKFVLFRILKFISQNKPKIHL